MHTTALILVLLAAAMHAAWNAAVKGSQDPLLTQSMVIGVGCLMGWFCLPWVRVPDPSSWVFIGLSVAIHTAYLGFLLLAYGSGDLSKVYPIARGTAPLLVSLLAARFAGESLTTREIAGVVLVSVGILSLALGEGPPRGRHGRAVWYSLATGLTISAYTLVDGMGVRRAETELGYIVWMFAFMGLPLVAFGLVRRRRAALDFVRAEWKVGLAGGGVMATLGYGIVVWALSLDAMARIVSLRETSVVMAALIGIVVLGEPARRRRNVAAVFVAAGNVLLLL